MTPWVRHTLAAYRFNTSYRIPGVGLSNAAVVERSILACTPRPTADQERHQRCLESRRVTFAVLEMFLAVSTFALQVQQFSARDSNAKMNPASLETSVGFILWCHVSSAKVLAHNCLGLPLVYELPSSKYHYPLATMVANLAKLTPERPALIRHDDDRQAHVSGLNNLSVQCQRASKAVAAMMHQCELLEPIPNPARHPDVDECSVEVHFSKIVNLRPNPTVGPSTFSRAHNQFSDLEHDDGLVEYPEDIFGTATLNVSVETALADVERLGQKRAGLRLEEKESDGLPS
ncbi:hypothetical protein M405DRAFT_840435, partial [Rhizopogon salebrosus TDB-379]